jgi:hypothetical protein
MEMRVAHRALRTEEQKMSRPAKGDDSLLVQDPAVSQRISPYSAHNSCA